MRHFGLISLFVLCAGVVYPFHRATDDTGGRSGVVQGHAIPARRPEPRRPRDDGDRRALAAANFLHGRSERGTVSDDGWRRHVDANLRTARFRSGRWDRSPSRTRTPTSFMSGQDPMASAATCRPAVESTSPSTAERPGSSRDFRRQGRSAPSGFIRRIRPSCGSRRTATPSRGIPTAACSRPRTAGRAGARCSSSTTASARWMSKCSRGTRVWCTRGCRGSSGSPGRSSAARVTGASTRAPTAATRSRKSRPGCRRN